MRAFARVALAAGVICGLGAGCTGSGARSAAAVDGSAGPSGPVVPLARAHAHNDYEHERPLHDALARGFCSVEADVFLVDGELLVAHWWWQTSAERTLERLYLDPLRERVARHGGRVLPDGPGFTLLIDLKSDGETTYAALREVLAGYREMLTVFGRDAEPEPGAVTVVVSGDRPRALMEAEADRLCGMDGRLSDLDGGASAALIPLVSDKWTAHFDWDGEGPMPAEERERLRSIVSRAHAAGRRVRFWATPESEALWAELVAAEVDLINTDELDRLRAFLLEAR